MELANTSVSPIPRVTSSLESPVICPNPESTRVRHYLPRAPRVPGTSVSFCLFDSSKTLED